MIRVRTDLLCDTCGNWISGPMADKPKAMLTRRLAKREGWLRGVSPGSPERPAAGFDLCPACVDRIMSEAAIAAGIKGDE